MTQVGHLEEGFNIIIDPLGLLVVTLGTQEEGPIGSII